jgi:outer membrane protein TolC
MLNALIIAVLAAAAEVPGPVPAAQATVLITLDEAVKSARKASPSLAASKEKIEQSEGWKRKALAAFIPAWTATLNYTRFNKEYNFTLPDVNSLRIITDPPYIVFDKYYNWTLQPVNAYAVSTTLNIPILNMSNIARYDAVKNQARAAAYSTDSYENEFIYSVASAYYAALGAKKVLAVATESLEMSKSHYNTAKARFGTGDLGRLAYLKAEIEVEKAEQDLRRSSNGYDSAREALAVLMDRDSSFDVADAADVPPPPGFNPEEKSSGDVDRLCDAAVGSRRDLAAAEMSLKATQRNRDEVMYRFIPTLQGTANFLYTNMLGLLGTNWQWYVGVSLNWVLYDGGVRYGDMRERNSLVTESMLNLAAQKANIRMQVRQAVIDADSCSAGIGSAKRQVELADESYRVARANFEQGLCTAMDVTDANATLSSARLNMAREELGCQLTRLKLLKVLGTIKTQFKGDGSGQ